MERTAEGVCSGKETVFVVDSAKEEVELTAAEKNSVWRPRMARCAWKVVESLATTVTSEKEGLLKRLEVEVRGVGVDGGECTYVESFVAI